MKAKVGYSAPMLHVKDVAQSVRFYELLGFTMLGSHKEPAGKLVWAELGCYRGSPELKTFENCSATLMLTQASDPVDEKAQGVLLYMYSPDLPGLREKLLGAGIQAGEIEPRFYMEKGEMRVTDPDGYCILIGQV